MTTPPPQVGGGYGLFLLESLLILLGVCLLAWAVIRFGVKRFYPSPGAGQGPLRVVARLPLEPRRTVYILEAGKKMLLVGASEQGLVSLGELDAGEVAAAEANVPKPKSFLELLRRRPQA